MKKEDKELLMKDLSQRLPYGIIVECNDDDGSLPNMWTVVYIDIFTEDLFLLNIENSATKLISIKDTKPYLFPMSSMSEEQIDELKDLCNMYDPVHDTDPYEDWGMLLIIKHCMDDEYHFKFNFKLLEFLNKNRLDYCGLISMGLAIDATGLDIY